MTEEIKSDVPRFVGDRARVKTFPLEWPVEYAGKVYHTISIRRLVEREVVDFLKKISATESVTWKWPVFIDDAGDPVPDVVIDALDADDYSALEKDLLDFLPRRFRVDPEPDSAQVNGEAIASS